MSLPPGFLDELRGRTSLARVVGRKVVWDVRKSNPGKGDMWAPCPFHQEKNASFHVDDRKGYYYCFGCHAKGDALSFIRETENVGFIEAVEILAREAAMPMPARDPLDQQKTDHMSRLVQVMDQAVRFYRLQLRSAAGTAARDYLTQRKLGDAALDRFEIGFAPDARQGLSAHLLAAGVAPDLMRDAGLTAEPEAGGAPYDRFRGRIIYPIRDGRGRCIGLGGRAMDPAARAKYLNSPETVLFDKGRSLYNHGPAREAAGKGLPLIVAEGYMDVIALVEAGFAAAVAPLGTAITEEQLRLIWRIHPEPIIALDGDRAGVAAALRLVDLALPLLEAGRGLRFCILPQGLDPDDLIRAGGPGAMQAVLDAAEPMVNLLWRREIEGKVFDSPERKATLDKSLRAALARINDASIRSHYAAEIKNLRWQLFAAARPSQRPPRASAGPGGPRGWTPPQSPALVAKRSALGSATMPDAQEHLFEALILAMLVTHPRLVQEFEVALETISWATDHAQLLQLMLRSADDPGRLRQNLAAAQPDLLEKLMQHSHVLSAPPVRNAHDADFARMCVAEDLAKLHARRGVQKETEDAMEDLAGLADEGVTWRLAEASRALHDADRSKLDDALDLGEDRTGLSRHLQNLIDGEVWVKKKR